MIIFYVWGLGKRSVNAIMDASEDAELHLQRASADLLREFSSSLPRFLSRLSPKVGQQSDEEQGPSARKLVKERSTEQLIKLVCPISDPIGPPDCGNPWSSSYSWSLFRNGLNCWILISVISFRFSILFSWTICPIIADIIFVHSEDQQQNSYHCPVGFAKSYTHYAKFVGKR